MMEHTCKNCGHAFNGKYCSLCGEKIFTDHDRSVIHLLDEALHFLTHFEGTFFKTLKTIFTKPGKFSLDYCNGIRKKYFKPVSFFFILVILYLLFPMFQGLNMKLHFHETHAFYGSYAKEKVDILLTQRNIIPEQLEASFHHTGEKVSKFLLFIIIPFIAFVSLLLGFRKRSFYFDHFIFSSEISSFLLLWAFLLLPLLLKTIEYFAGNLGVTEEILLYITVFPLIIYVIIAAKRFFSFQWWYSILYAIVFCLSLILFIEYIYKFILFLIAINIV